MAPVEVPDPATELEPRLEPLKVTRPFQWPPQRLPAPPEERKPESA